jgi:cytochrome c biogenesis protein CcmG, thiol:disulfide interchange protein DsbE
MTPKRLSIAAGAVALLAALAIGLVQLAGSSRAPTARATLTLAQARALLAGSPPALAALHDQASELLGGGRALHARLAALRGHPLVINKWASWCVPCRSEFGAFQAASVALGRRVAFLGIDSAESSRRAGRAFLRGFPVAYPSYYDHSGALGTAITGSSFTPVTVFYDSSGSQYIRQGPYPTAGKLEADVRRYALDEKIGRGAGA